MTPLADLTRPYRDAWTVARQVPRALVDIVMLRPIRHLWRTDRQRFWSAVRWAVWLEGSVLWAAWVYR